MEKTIKIVRHGLIHQIPISPLSSIRYFGGGGGTKVETIDPYAGTGIRELYKALTEFVQPQIGQGVTPYEGQMVPGVSPIQEAGFGLAGGLPGMVTGPQQYFQDVLGLAQPELAGRGMGMAEQTLQDVLAPFDPTAATELWETAWKRPALETWREDVMPAIMEKGVRTAGTAESGPMRRELARSGERLTTNLSGQLANLLYSGQQAQMGRQQAGVGQAMGLAALPSNVLQQAGQVGGMGTDILGQMLNIGGMQRGITGEQLQEPYAKWQQAQPWANPYLKNFLGSALSQPPMETLAQGQGPGLGAMMMPALGSMLGQGGLGGMLGQSGLGGFTSGLFSGPGSIVPATMAGQLGGGLQGLLGGLGGAAGGALGGLGGLLGGAAGGIGGALSGLLALCDVRVKENFARIDNALEKVKRLEGLTYNFTNEDNRSAGIIAQELEKVLPEGVVEHHGLKFVRLDAVVGLLVSAINELSQKIESRSN